MRNTTTEEVKQGFISPKKLQEIFKISKKLTSYYEFQDVEKHLQNVLLAWIGSDFIENQNKVERENVFLFLSEFKILISSFFDVDKNQKENALQIIDNFFDSWTPDSINSILRQTKNSFICSDIADSKEMRIDGFEFLELIEDLLKKIIAVNK